MAGKSKKKEAALVDPNDYSEGYAVHFRVEPKLAIRIHKFHTAYAQELDRLGATATMTSTVKRLLCLALDAEGL